jgi:glycerol-3-phosphate O-acyltransferase
MTRTVALPLWLLLLILLFAGVTFLSHFLFPSVRWFVRQRTERVVGRLNRRLKRPIEPFKLARRYDMIQRLIYDPAVLRAVADESRENGIPENVAFERARDFAREIVPAFSATLYFSSARGSRGGCRGRSTGSGCRRSTWRARPAAARGDGGLRDEPPVNMDYVLVTWLVSRSGR